MAVITIVDPILGLYQKLAEPNETPSFDVDAGVTTTGISGGGGVTVIADGGTLTGTYEGDVLCKGNATLTGNVTVQGKLTVLSALTNNAGHELIVNGDLIVLDNFDFNHTDPNAVQSNVTVDGNFIIKGFYLNFLQGGESEATLLVGGDLISSNGFTGTQINAYGNDNTAGLDVIVYGDMSGFSNVNIYGGDATSGGQGGFGGDFEVYGSYTGQGNISMYGGNGSTFGNGGSGGSFHCHGNVALGNYDIRTYGGNAEGNNAGNGGNFVCGGNISVKELDLYGGGDTSGGQGGSGGNFEVYGSYTGQGNIRMYGGNGSIGGSGGNFHCHGDIALGDYDIRMYGGNAQDSNAGNGGNFVCDGNISVEELDLYGGDVTVATTGGNGGNGGSIGVNGHFNASSDVDSHGGDGGGSGFAGGSGGNINIDGNFIVEGSVLTYGGDCIDGNSAGNGGYVDVFVDMSAGGINTHGGNGTNSPAGNGGYVSVDGNLSLNENGEDLLTYGGDCTSTDNTHVAGFGGSISCGTLIWPTGVVNTNAGTRSGNTTSAGAGNGGSSAGSITIGGDMLVNGLLMNGSNINTEYKSFAGGVGGNLTVNGSLTILSDAEVNGGSSTGYDGGASGAVFVSGGPAYISSITIQGGASNPAVSGGDGPANRGSVTTSIFTRGITAVNFTFKDGEEVVGSSPATAIAFLQFAGNCHINLLDVEDRNGVHIMSTDVLPLTLNLGSMPNKKVLSNRDLSSTIDVTSIVGGLNSNFFTYGIGDGKWYAHSGTDISPP